MNINEFWQAILNQDRDGLRSFFCDNAVIRWHCSNEQFTVSEYIRANCEYPGNWDGEIERIEEIGSTIVLVGHVFPVDKSASFHVVSFILTQDDRILEMDEYWADDGDAPTWRRDMKIGKPIR